jgi:hypothetical protein
MPEITSVTSEALQATVRRLLPSQQGFGNDLQATNLITPIIDLTPTAEGSVLSTNLQTAMAFDSQTTNKVDGATVTLVNTPGFFRVFGSINVQESGGAAAIGDISLSDGSSSKKLYEIDMQTSSVGLFFHETVDFNVFLRAGDSLTATSNASNVEMTFTTRQLADVTGNLTNPGGFTFE